MQKGLPKKQKNSIKLVVLLGVVTATFFSCANPEKPTSRPLLNNTGRVVITQLLSLIKPLLSLSDVKMISQTFPFEMAVEGLPTISVVPFNPTLPACVSLYRTAVETSYGTMTRTMIFPYSIIDTLITEKYAVDSTKFRVAYNFTDSLFDTAIDTLVGRYVKTGSGSINVKLDTLWRIRAYTNVNSHTVSDTEIYVSSDSILVAAKLILTSKRQSTTQSVGRFTNRRIDLLNTRIAAEVVTCASPDSARTLRINRDFDSLGVGFTSVANSRIYMFVDSLFKSKALVQTTMFADTAIRNSDKTRPVDGVVYHYIDSLQDIRVITTQFNPAVSLSSLMLDYSQLVSASTQPKLSGVVRKEYQLIASNYNESTILAQTDSTSLLYISSKHPTKNSEENKLLENYDSSHIKILLNHTTSWKTDSIFCSSLSRTDFYPNATSDSLALDSANWLYTLASAKKLSALVGIVGGTVSCNLYYNRASLTKNIVWNRSFKYDTTLKNEITLTSYKWFGVNRDSVIVNYTQLPTTNTIKYSIPTRGSANYEHHGEIVPQLQGGVLIIDTLNSLDLPKKPLRKIWATLDSNNLGTMSVSDSLDSASLTVRSDSLIWMPVRGPATLGKRVAFPHTRQLTNVAFVDSTQGIRYELSATLPVEGGIYKGTLIARPMADATGILVNTANLQCSPSFFGSATIFGLYDIVNGNLSTKPLEISDVLLISPFAKSTLVGNGESF